MPTLHELKARILKDGRVTQDEAYQLIEEVMRGSITQRERRELHELLIDYGNILEPGARDSLERALGITSRVKLERSAPVRDEAELAPVRAVLALVEAAGHTPTLFELSVGDQKENPAFKGELAQALKRFVAAGNSSLTPAEALTLARGLSAGTFHDGEPGALFHPGDRLQVAVHYPDGSLAETHGVVVSAGDHPLVLVVNKHGHFQMIRQDPRSREQLTVKAILAGSA